MRLRIAVLAGIVSVSGVAHGQTAADSMSYTWLVNASHSAVDSGEFNPSAELRGAQFKRAEEYARRAVAANPNDAEGHFELARSIGKNALTMGTRDKIKFAGEVREQALAALKLNPKHAGALHVMGVWNAEVMRLNGLSRLFAKTFLGGQIFDEASWDNAQKYLEDAVAQDPNRITHHLDLGMVYSDRSLPVKAIEQYKWVAAAPIVDFNDVHYKEQAAQRLKDLR
jgi:tetratricopeptide (TPR) repeat protein